ncbi:MAG TPA: DUF4347 domain-containing protein, partial [Ramlibacter sp.]|nr:DUF4347 domain-containing protein [Ramlibacter sp.]
MKTQERSLLARLGNAWQSRKPVAAPSAGGPRKQYAPLEARVLFDAAGAVAAERQLDDTGQQGGAPEPRGASDARESQERSHLLEPGASAAAGTGGQTLVIIDSRVQDYEQLLQGVDPAATIRIVGPDEDGLQVVSALLGTTGNVASLQIVSHG